MINQINIKEGWLIGIFLITAVSLFFIPPIIQISSIELRVDDVIILSVMPLTLLVLYKQIELSTYVKILIAVFVSMVLSVIYGYLMLEVPFSMRDINELIRMIKPLFLFSFLLLLDKELFKELLFKFLIAAMVVFIFIGLCEALKVPYLFEFFTQQYSSTWQDGIHRINTTTLNPNDGAVLTLFFLFFSISMLVVYKKWYYFLSTFALIYILLNTGSRTAFLIAIIFFIVFFIFTKSLTLKHKIFFLIIGTIGIILSFSYIEHYIDRILTLVNALKLEDTSLNRRIGYWQESLEWFYQSKFFGWGAAKAIHHTVVDGEYFLLLKRYGAIGFTLVLVAMTYPLYVIQKRLKQLDLNKEGKVIYYTLFSYLVAGLFVMGTNNFFTSYILIFPYILLVAVLFGSKKEG